MKFLSRLSMDMLKLLRMVVSFRTDIEWRENKNVTVEFVSKLQKGGARSGRHLTKKVKTDSFFNFFEPSVTKSRSQLNEYDVSSSFGLRVVIYFAAIYLE